MLGLISIIAPVIVGGNTCILLSSEKNPMVSISFAEVLNTSDVPHGVVNILTGKRKELMSHFASHKDVNAIFFCGENDKEIRDVKMLSVENMKRVTINKRRNWALQGGQSPYFIEKFQETKTIWHPNEV